MSVYQRTIDLIVQDNYYADRLFLYPCELERLVSRRRRSQIFGSTLMRRLKSDHSSEVRDLQRNTTPVIIRD